MSLKIPRDPKGFLIVILLATGAMTQVVYLSRTEILGTITRIQERRNLPGDIRGASMAFGDRIAEYIAWLQGIVPSDSIVLIPPPEEHDVLSQEGLMQYYLIPRVLTNCPRDQSAEVCISTQRGFRTYVLHVGSFPPTAPLGEAYHYERFDEEWGLYIPSP